MNTYVAKSLLFTSLVEEVRIDVNVSNWPSQYQYLLQGLATGFYPGGGGPMQEVYESLVAQAAVHGMWIRRSRGGAEWTIHLAGDIPPRMGKALHERSEADRVAFKLAFPGKFCWAGDGPTAMSFTAYTRTLQDKQWLKSLAGKYVDERYRQRIEPFIKRVENGKLVVRRAPSGKWSIG